VTIPADVANNLNKPFELCYLIKIEFSGLTLAITDAPFEIDHDGLTYIPSDLLVSVGDIKSSSETKVNTTNLAFSSVDQTIVALMLANNQIGRDVYIYQVYFYEDNSFIPVRPTTSNLEYKTRVNDTVINYTIDFEYAFNTINNI